MDYYDKLEKQRIAPGSGPTTPDVPRPIGFQRLPDQDDNDDDIPIVDELLFQLSRGYKASARSSSTKSSYKNDFDHFSAWCQRGGYKAMPASAETVDFYLSDHGDKFAVATLERRLVGIAFAHRQAGHETQTGDKRVRDTLQGIRRRAADEGTSAPRQAAPILTDELREIVGKLDTESLQGKRDKAMLLWEFSCALRAGEVGMLHVSDLREVGAKGFIVTLRRSKTDQMGKGLQVAVAHGVNPDFCPVIALRQWLQAAELKKGPLFPRIDRHDNVGTVGLTRMGVNLVIKRAVKNAGFDPTHYSGHSLRAGLATSAALSNASYAKIKAQGRWKSDTVLQRYIRDAELFRDNAATSAGL